MKNFDLKFVAGIILVVLISRASLQGQNADYGFLGEQVFLLENNADTLTSGLLLEDNIFTNEQIDVITVRYDSDTVVTNRNGNQVQVQRLFDIYAPKDDLSLVYADGNIDQLPVMLVLHAGQGNKQTIADYAYEWAVRGYIVLSPSYRSDRLGVGYCHTYAKSIYLAAQDISAVIRTFSFLYDDLQSSNPIVDDNELAGKPIDGHSIFMSGKSWGGTSAFHAASRLIQEQWEDYLGAGEPYIVNGLEGPIDIGDSGGLHSTGRNQISNYEMPYDRIKGAICRTAAIFSDDQINYSVSPNKVPICFIIGTCDKIVPYVSRTTLGQDGLCDADLTYPDGTEVNSFTLYGPDYISERMAEADVYSKIITFCGGGHDTNGCVNELIERRGTDFIVDILSDEILPGVTDDIIYRYDFANYSNQCCDIGENYSYIEKCDCTDDNPFEVTDLEFIDMDGCDFLNECEIESICSLEPLSDGFIEPIDITSNVSIVKCEQGVCLQLSSIGQTSLEFEYFSVEGKELYNVVQNIEAGTNIIPVPSILPVNSVVILKIEGYKRIKFFLRAI
ncbi:MAG: alpha/beta hydrolase [Flavobacteriales bacterium]|nr:alpha/beta hydrolase [Flavobacteriales bacterium]